MTTTVPKIECCLSPSPCATCPVQMLKDGTLPAGFTVKRRRLVTLDGKPVSKRKVAKAMRRHSSTKPSRRGKHVGTRKKRDGRPSGASGWLR